ncbi:Nnf1 [Niveomyces insectorum RCEF 264]|uniref:Nnf1 n=1 Tax=Niveomyces insectorum RCEF 264 TaxID=1081102 RepID=A0A162I6Y1_9HYPO|nr:Nnf1 [Niveomyces insectorum RCEF 264]
MSPHEEPRAAAAQLATATATTATRPADDATTGTASGGMLLDEGALEGGNQAASQQPTRNGTDKRSPTPPPPPPPPGPRASRLQAVFDSSLDHTLDKISWGNFSACYPTAASRAPGALRTIHKAMAARLRELCAAEFTQVMLSRDAVPKLNELEALIAEAEARRQVEAATGQTVARPPCPPHTLLPETVVAAHLASQRRAQRALLEARLQAMQAANAARFTQLTTQQDEAEQLVAAVERALADADGAAALLDSDKLAVELARESRLAEVEMSQI